MPNQSITREQMAVVINGKSGNVFDPQGTATRAGVFAVLRRLSKTIFSIIYAGDGRCKQVIS